MARVLRTQVLVIGGGINGTGAARDLALRGVPCVLVEKKELGSGTTWASSGMIHGGLRYLEQFEFRLVAEALAEREILLGIARHLVWPARFIMPHVPGLRPRWMIRAGLFLYDHLARRASLPGSQAVRLDIPPFSSGLKPQFRHGFMYSDCRVDDARLVISNAMDARRRGAEILTRTECSAARRDGPLWRITLGNGREIRARAIVNAAGPWVKQVLDARLGQHDNDRVRLVKGSHIVVPRRYEGDHAYLLQQKDRRVVFVIPYEGDFTLIGTTEVDFQGDPITARISPEETDYLCAAYNESFSEPVTKDDVIWAYSGVRALFDDGKGNPTTASRDYKLYRHKDMQAPMISVFGGKLTTHRRLAQDAVSKILKMAGRPGAAWTCAHALPGGDTGDFSEFMQAQAKKYPWLPDDLLKRYGRSYGTRMDKFLDGSASLGDLGKNYGDGIYEAEIVYMARYEWARTAEDVLWRRSKLGLRASPATEKNLAAAIQSMNKEEEGGNEKSSGH